MTTVDKYCATCGVRWSGYGGFYHTVDCPQYMKQESAEALDHVDYTPPSDLTEYERGWNDAIKTVIRLAEGRVRVAD
jgi:hypothetical protein